MEKNILSKSTYIKGNQCLKYLFLYKKYPKLKDPIPQDRLARFNRGTDVGVYAQQIFLGGIDCSPKSPSQYQKMIEFTAAQIETGTKVLYEALFQFDKTLVIIDILVMDELGKYHAYEVKSSLKLSETYFEDASLQYYVIKNCLPNLETISLIHLNPEYVLKSEIELSTLFKTEDITSIAKERYSLIEEKIHLQLITLEQENLPNIKVGAQCYHPYDCEYLGYCWQHIPKPNFFDIPSVRFYGSEEEFDFQNFEEEEIDVRFADDEIAIQQAKALLNNEKYQHSIYNFQNPIFVKLLWMKPAIPIFEGTKPYENRLIGYSVIRFIGEEKKEFTEISENQDSLFSNLKNLVSSENTIICFEENQDLTKSVFPENRIVNLLEDLKNGEFYHPSIKADFDIQNVMLAYTGKRPWFGKVSNDYFASVKFESLHSKMDKIENEEIGKDILFYMKNYSNSIFKLYENL